MVTVVFRYFKLLGSILVQAEAGVLAVAVYRCHTPRGGREA